MNTIDENTKRESIEAFQSAIRKSESALLKMKQKGTRTTLLDKRLQALQVGLAVLEEKW